MEALYAWAALDILLVLVEHAGSIVEKLVILAQV
jgi:DNA-binding winged helix-turn-helix (wHTH) protein